MQVEKFKYDNTVVRYFALASTIWGLVGMLVGLIVAILMFWPGLFESMGIHAEWNGFGRLRPLHTNAVIFAFVGNMISLCRGY